MHTVYTMESTIRATPSQFRFLCRMIRAQRKQASERITFQQMRDALGVVLLRACKKYGICEWTGGKEGGCKLNEERLNTFEIWVDGDADPQPGIEPIRLHTHSVGADDKNPAVVVRETERMHADTFFDRVCDRLSSSSSTRQGRSSVHPAFA